MPSMRTPNQGGWQGVGLVSTHEMLAGAQTAQYLHHLCLSLLIFSYQCIPFEIFRNIMETFDIHLYGLPKGLRCSR